MKSNPKRIAKITILSIFLIAAGVLLGGIGSIFVAQTAMGRLGKPVDEEGMVSLLGMPIGGLMGVVSSVYITRRWFPRLSSKSNVDLES